MKVSHFCKRPCMFATWWKKSLLREPDTLQGFVLEEELPELVLGLGSNVVELARSLGNAEGIDTPIGLHHSCLLADGVLEDSKEGGLLGCLDIRRLAVDRISDEQRDEVVELVDRGGLHHSFLLFARCLLMSESYQMLCSLATSQVAMLKYFFNMLSASPQVVLPSAKNPGMTFCCMRSRVSTGVM